MLSLAVTSSRFSQAILINSITKATPVIGISHIISISYYVFLSHWFTGSSQQYRLHVRWFFARHHPFYRRRPKRYDNISLKMQIITVFLTWNDPGPVSRGQASSVRHLRRGGVRWHDAYLLKVGRLAMVQKARAASGRGGLRVRGLPTAGNALHQPHIGQR